jgi:biotin carboxyl carrier protein
VLNVPIYEALIDGKLRQIELTKTTEKTFTAKIDDKQLSIELTTDRPEPGKGFMIKVRDKTYRVEMPSIERDKPVQIRVEEAAFKAEVKTPRKAQSLTTFEPAPMAQTKKQVSTKQVAAEGAITAPMTGKIVSVKVKSGDTVKQNQVLCIIEAMKMENEIAAPKAGTVQEVSVQEGSSVSEGETLFIIA